MIFLEYALSRTRDAAKYFQERVSKAWEDPLGPIPGGEIVLSKKPCAETSELVARIDDITTTATSTIDDLTEQVQTLQAHLQTQINGIRWVKREAKINKRRFTEAAGKLIKNYKTQIENGVNPITGKRENRYAFVSSDGKITAFSPRAQKILGYKPGEINYDEIIPHGIIDPLSPPDEEITIKRIHVKMAGASRTRVLKEVKVTPLRISDVTLGYVIDFKTIGRIEELRSLTVERLLKKRNPSHTQAEGEVA